MKTVSTRFGEAGRDRGRGHVPVPKPTVSCTYLRTEDPRREPASTRLGTGNIQHAIQVLRPYP